MSMVRNEKEALRSSGLDKDGKVTQMVNELKDLKEAYANLEAKI